MGNGEIATPSKAGKASSSVLERTNIHPYSDWAAMQAYYGAGVTMAPPYFNTTVTPPGHAPHPYMWGPQLIMPPPFGTPYPAIYPLAGVYSQPSEGGHGTVTLPTARETALVMQETTAKSTNDKDNGILKKQKGPDGLAVSVCNGSDDKEAQSVADASSQSTESETKGSSSGSDKNNMKTGTQSQTQSKRSAVDTASGKPLDSDTMGRMKLPVSSANSKLAPQVSPTRSTFTQNPDGASPGQWIQNEREIKRERRKQSNRESARRSRLRKQAETEELAQKVESLSAENLVLKSEINRLSDDSAKLRQENSSLMDKLKNAESLQKGDSSDDKMEARISPFAGTENLLSKIA